MLAKFLNNILCDLKCISLPLTRPGSLAAPAKGRISRPPLQSDGFTWALASERASTSSLSAAHPPFPSLLRKTLHRPKSSFTLGSENRSRQEKEGKKEGRNEGKSKRRRRNKSGRIPPPSISSFLDGRTQPLRCQPVTREGLLLARSRTCSMMMEL